MVYEFRFTKKYLNSNCSLGGIYCLYLALSELQLQFFTPHYILVWRGSSAGRAPSQKTQICSYIKLKVAAETTSGNSYGIASLLGWSHLYCRSCNVAAKTTSAAVNEKKKIINGSFKGTLLGEVEGSGSIRLSKTALMWILTYRFIVKSIWRN